LSRSEKTGTSPSWRNRRRVFASYIEASSPIERDLKPSTSSWTKTSSPGRVSTDAPASFVYSCRSLASSFFETITARRARKLFRLTSLSTANTVAVAPRCVRGSGVRSGRS
jgi:hypothetical protein